MNRSLRLQTVHGVAQSHLYKWSREMSFVKLQSFQTSISHDVKSFRINGDTFIVFTNDSGAFTYLWNGTMFAPFQSFPTGLTRSVHPFVMCGQPYLALALSKSVVLYWFSGSEFIKYQDIPTRNAKGLTSFEYKGHTYLAVAKYKASSGERNTNSKIYIWI